MITAVLPFSPDTVGDWGIEAPVGEPATMTISGTQNHRTVKNNFPGFGHHEDASLSPSVAITRDLILELVMRQTRIPTWEASRTKALNGFTAYVQ